MSSDRTVTKEIGQILMNDWDPLGIRDIPGRPDDEYDSYIKDISLLLSQRASVVTIQEHLKRIESTQMGIRRDDNELLFAAQMLFALESGLT